MELKNKLRIIINKSHSSLNAVIKNKAIILLLILAPFFSIIVPVIFVPFWASAAYIVQVNTILVVGLIYGTIVFGFKKSTLGKNEKMIIDNRSVSYIAALFIVMIFVFITSVIQFILLVMLNKLNLLMPDWVFVAEDPTWVRGYDFSNMRFIGWAWAIFWTAMITFGIYFMFRTMIKTEKVHYSVTLGILIIAFVWGGTLNDYWGGSVLIGDKYERGIISTLFPKELYWPTLILFPFFAPGQFASQVADFTITSNGEQWVEFSQNNQFAVHLTFNKEYEFMSEWNALIIAPIIWTTFLTISGLMLGKVKEE